MNARYFCSLKQLEVYRMIFTYCLQIDNNISNIYNTYISAMNYYSQYSRNFTP